MFLLFDLVFLLYALFYLPYLLVTQRVYKGFSMRFGIFSPSLKAEVQQKANVWMHAVSVGEVMLLEGFIDRFAQEFPQYQVIVSVTTKTGFALAQERLKNKAVVIASPLDFSFVVGRFIQLIDPKMYIAVETEIWPNLYRQLYQAHIPIMVINGRISDQSFGRYKAISFLLKGILQYVQVWCMQAQEHAKRIIELGAPKTKVKVTGNIKFDDLPQIEPAAIDLNRDKLWWVAGSTHPGEEEIVLDIYNKIVVNNPQWRLIIAPRHVERVAEIIDLINSRGMKAVKFSELKKTAWGNFIVVVDTVGDLRSLYALSSLVFVGKSLCVGGGHNIIEPAFYGKAIVIGPKVGNFRDIVACFKAKNAIVQVDQEGFAEAVIDLITNPSKRDALGAACRDVIAENQGASKRTLELAAQLLK